MSKAQLAFKAKTYQCTECESGFTKRSYMLRHLRSQHEGIKFNCKQCDYEATQNHNLQKHIQSEHEGIKYICANVQKVSAASMLQHPCQYCLE